MSDSRLFVSNSQRRNVSSVRKQCNRCDSHLTKTQPSAEVRPRKHNHSGKWNNESRDRLHKVRRHKVREEKARVRSHRQVAASADFVAAWI